MVGNHKLLYIDDDAVNLTIFKIVFGNLYDVIITNNAENALEKLAFDDSIQLIITDMNMPSMNGLEFLEQANREFPTKNYFMLTGYEVTKEIQDSIDNRLMIKCFGKPLNKTEIIEELIKVTK
jgi:two-component system response regulator (stage 0 sporulation protein F)